LQDKKKKPIRCEAIINSITYLVSTLFYYHISFSLHRRSFLPKADTHRSVEILCADWAVGLLNVSLALHQENVSIAGGRNAVAGSLVQQLSEISSIHAVVVPHSKNGLSGGA
jgi:hypothetical protein